MRCSVLSMTVTCCMHGAAPADKICTCLFTELDMCVCCKGPAGFYLHHCNVLATHVLDGSTEDVARVEVCCPVNVWVKQGVVVRIGDVLQST
jgi:hypothetical protein